MHGQVAGLVAGEVQLGDAVTLADIGAEVDELGKSGMFFSTGKIRILSISIIMAW